MNFNTQIFKRGSCILAFVAVIILTSSSVFAQGTGVTTSNPGTGVTTSNPSQTFTLSNPLKVDSVAGLIQSFVDIFSYLVILGAVLAIIWVGLQFILAQGNPERLNELKKWLLGIIIGVAVVIGARIIVDIVINTLESTGVVNQSTIQAVKKANGQ